MKEHPETHSSELEDESGESKTSSFSQLAAVKKGVDEHTAESVNESKTAMTAEGVSRFVESLIRKNIVSRKTVHDAVVWKKARGDGEKRHLFQILIDNYEIDREEVYAEFVHYYSFKSIDLAAIEIDS